MNHNFLREALQQKLAALSTTEAQLIETETMVQALGDPRSRVSQSSRFWIVEPTSSGDSLSSSMCAREPRFFAKSTHGAPHQRARFSDDWRFEHQSARAGGGPGTAAQCLFPNG